VNQRPLQPHVLDGEVVSPPRTRDECATRLGAGGAEGYPAGEFPPCGWVTCEHHLAHWFVGVGGAGRELSDRDVESISDRVLSLPVSCVLDVIDRRGALNGPQMGRLFGFSREWSRKLERVALDALHAINASDGHETLRVMAEEIHDPGEAVATLPAALVRTDHTEVPQRRHLPVIASSPGAQTARRPADTFRCDKIGATVRASLCAGRHQARHPGTDAVLYPICAGCSDGAGVARRIAPRRTRRIGA
jgi:hypothetical protein